MPFENETVIETAAFMYQQEQLKDKNVSGSVNANIWQCEQAAAEG